MGIHNIINIALLLPASGWYLETHISLLLFRVLSSEHKSGHKPLSESAYPPDFKLGLADE